MAKVSFLLLMKQLFPPQQHAHCTSILAQCSISKFSPLCDIFGCSEAQAQQVMRIVVVVVVLVGTKFNFKVQIKSFEAWSGIDPATISFTSRRSNH